MKQNSYPMKEWHVEHMKNIILKFVTGLTENASRREVRINNKYGKIGIVCKRINYDIKHGVTNNQVCSFLHLIKTESSFSQIRAREGSMERLDEIQAIFHARRLEDFIC
jgi:hypothetical protein